MKKIRFAVSFCLILAGLTVAKETNALSPGYYHSGVGRLHSGWGWYPFSGLHSIPLYGYSYYPYFGYAVRYSTFGAIAYSPSTGRKGWSWGNSDQASAQIGAVNFCGVADCTPVVWVQGGCAAIATSATGGNLGWGYDAGRYQSRTRALAACRASGYADCEVQAWVCSY